MKDPAFLLYVKDFYEGTRTMLPEERACYLDLLCFQHQKGIIPKDLKRVLLYCSGISEGTLKATLKAKFQETPEGWINERLSSEVNRREEYAEKQSGNGILGAFFKFSKAKLKAAQYKDLREYVFAEYGKESFIEFLKKEKESNKGYPLETLEGTLKHLATANENETETLINTIKEPLSPLEEIWQLWTRYKHKEHGFRFKSEESKAIAKNKFEDLHKGDPDLALDIVEQSISNGWKGLFEMKSDRKQYEKKSRLRGIFGDEAVNNLKNQIHARNNAHQDGGRLLGS